MFYEMMRYASSDHFNTDARCRYEQVKGQSTALSYDCWWIVEQIIAEGEHELLVVWSRQDPPKLRK